MGKQVILSVEKLTVAYGNNVVIDSASFEVEEGDFVCVVGANGSGKSTLIRALLGLIPAKSKSIAFAEDCMRTVVGYLPQEAQIDKKFPATVLEIVLSGNLGRMGRRMFYGQDEKKRAMWALEKLKIGRLKEASFGDLSGGQKQKVLLARALVATTSLLFLDEPSNNLDYKSRKDFYQTLRELNREGLTIVMITHDLDVDDLIGNKVLAIKDGKVSLCATGEYLEEYR